MANIKTSLQFDMTALSKKYPGQLVFRGTPGELPGETEIQSRDVSAEELEAAIKDALLNPALKNAAMKLPLIVHREELKQSRVSPLILWQILSIVISVGIVMILHLIGVM
jgi:hypothetical protein